MRTHLYTHTVLIRDITFRHHSNLFIKNTVIWLDEGTICSGLRQYFSQQITRSKSLEGFGSIQKIFVGSLVCVSHYSCKYWIWIKIQTLEGQDQNKNSKIAKQIQILSILPEENQNRASNYSFGLVLYLIEQKGQGNSPGYFLQNFQVILTNLVQ